MKGKKTPIDWEKVKICRDCVFFKEDKDEELGRCRYNPPVIFPHPTDEYSYESVFPEVLEWYWCGKFEGNPEKTDMGGLVGKFFHSIESDKIKWQGRVLSAECDNHFLVQLYSYLDGQSTDQKLIPFSEMTGWNFYNTDKEMRYAYFKTQDRPEREFEQMENEKEKSLKNETNEKITEINKKTDIATPELPTEPEICQVCETKPVELMSRTGKPASYGTKY